MQNNEFFRKRNMNQMKLYAESCADAFIKAGIIAESEKYTFIKGVYEGMKYMLNALRI